MINYIFENLKCARFLYADFCTNSLVLAKTKWAAWNISSSIEGHILLTLWWIKWLPCIWYPNKEGPQICIRSVTGYWTKYSTKFELSPPPPRTFPRCFYCDFTHTHTHIYNLVVTLHAYVVLNWWPPAPYHGIWIEKLGHSFDTNGISC